jgi:hypothetical protein
MDLFRVCSRISSLSGWRLKNILESQLQQAKHSTPQGVTNVYIRDLR